MRCCNRLIISLLLPALALGASSSSSGSGSGAAAVSGSGASASGSGVDPVWYANCRTVPVSSLGLTDSQLFEGCNQICPMPAAADIKTTCDTKHSFHPFYGEFRDEQQYRGSMQWTIFFCSLSAHATSARRHANGQRARQRHAPDSCTTTRLCRLSSLALALFI